jgi:Gas vesicle synthesis protein GvpO
MAESTRSKDVETEQNGTASEELVEGLKQAAKAAAASAALGALVATAKALSDRRSSSHEEPDDAETEPQPDAEEEREPEETESPAAQSEPERDEEPEETESPAAQSEPERDEEPERESEPQRENLAPEPQQPEAQKEPREQEPVPGASPSEAQDVVSAARSQLQALVGKEPELISALESTGEGWLVTLEVVEVSRIPESTDVLASYEFELDDDLNLRRYARVRRYNRSQAEREGT